MNLIERARQYRDGADTIMEWLGSGAVTVDPATAQRRADICLKCPLNVQESAITEVMASAIRMQVELKNNLQLRVKGEKSLKSCSACGCVTRLKIWIPLKDIMPDPIELEKFDERCWLRNET
jgi:hypothetical protein